jgi:predicted Zn-dependent protease with MMP-like domain
MAYHVSKSKFAELVERALSELPEPFLGYLELVPVQVEMRPSKALLREVGLDDDELLFGLYQGASLLEGSELEGRGTPRPNHILIFQEDHELVAGGENELVLEVRKTVLHELGHHFGMSEDDLDELGYG